jgi:hypothetical protein
VRLSRTRSMTYVIGQVVDLVIPANGQFVFTGSGASSPSVFMMSNHEDLEDGT